MKGFAMLGIQTFTLSLKGLWGKDRPNTRHEGVGEVVEVGSKVKDFKPGDRVVVPAITPDWRTLEAVRGYGMHSGGMLAGWKFSNIKDGFLPNTSMLTMRI